jgi:excisionase family DNA binding protein
MESMMTARQVAELLGVHENWVYDQAASGLLPTYKIGGARRFDAEELRTWIAEHRAAERRPQVRGQTIREAVTPPAAGTRAGRSRNGTRASDQSKRSSDGKRRAGRRRQRPSAAEVVRGVNWLSGSARTVSQ